MVLKDAPSNPPSADDKPLIVRLATMEKAGALVGLAATWLVGYRVAVTLTEYRLAALEKQAAETAARVEQQEKFGHPDHERRINAIEIRQATTDQAVVGIDKKLDHVTTVVEIIAAKQNKP